MLKCLILSEFNYLYQALTSVNIFAKKVKFVTKNKVNQAYDIVIYDNEQVLPANSSHQIALTSNENDLVKIVEEIENFINYSDRNAQFNDIAIDTLSRIISYNDQKIPVTELECKILVALIRAKFYQISKNFIKTRIFNYQNDTETNTIENHVYNLRLKLINCNIPIMIESIDEGYKIKSI